MTRARPSPYKHRGDALAKEEPLVSEIAKDPELKQIVEVGARMEGLTRHASVHAAGVVITAVADGSPAQSIGFQKGDIVVSVNDQKIDQPADLERVAATGVRQWRVTIMRGGQQISVMFSG